MQPAPRSAPRLASLAAVCFALVACVAPQRSRTGLPSSGVGPSLEEIFLLPSLHGVPPRVRSVSADGVLALVDWRPLERDAQGRRTLGADLGPHWLATAGPALTPGVDTSLPSFLERALDASEPGEARVRAPAWSPTGHRLALLWRSSIVLVDWTPEGAPAARVLYRDPPEGALDERNEPLPRLGAISALAFTDGGATLEVRAGGEIHHFPLESGALPLSLSAAANVTQALSAPVTRVEFSGDRQRAFSREGKLVDDPARAGEHFHDFATGRGVVLEGLEGAKRIDGLDLSPCGNWVFAFELDDTRRNKPTLIPDYLTERVTTRSARSELADDEWQERRAYVWSTVDGRRRELELPGERRTPASAIGWAPSGPARFAFRRTSSDYRSVETWVWSDVGLRLALVERDEHWVGGPGAFARWSDDGTRILLCSEGAPFSTTPGRNQLFALDPESGELTQLTEVEGEVSSWTVSGAVLLVCASRNDPARRELGVVEERGVRWLPVPEGMNTTLRPSGDGSHLVFEHEELGVPAELWSVRTDGSRPATRLTATIPAAYRERDWILPEKLEARSSDGERVHAHVYSPPGSSLARPSAPRPCVVFIHGAGYLQNVTDSMTEYAVNLMFHSRLAEQGYVVADVDYRGSAGYGGKFRGDVQFQLGKLELADIGAVIDELARRGVVDPARVACYGGSYGGFLTLMALFQEPDRWVGGAALRSVTDWRTYHPGYTQPRLGRPSTHPEAYAASSPIDHAEKLRDPLLILHGMVDSNVFAQDSIRLIEKLIDLGIDFDAMLYPSQDHGFEDGMHWLDEYRRIERFLVRCLEEQ